MEDSDDDAREAQTLYPRDRKDSTHRSKIPPYHYTTTNRYAPEYEEDDEVEGANDEYDCRNDEEHSSDDENANGYDAVIEEDEHFERHPKKRKLRNLASGCDFGPRGVNLSNSDSGLWSEHATHMLLEAWGKRFLQLGRKSLRSEDWNEVAEKVSEASSVEITEEQCRSRLDVLKKKYKKEKEKVKKTGLGSSKWIFFKKMDMLMGLSIRQEQGLACGVDSGEYVFMNTRVYLDRSNGLDEMRDSPSESEMSEEEDGEERQIRFGLDGGEEGSSFRLLADSVQKFGEIYEKIEDSKRQQMMELEKMRMDFHRELELQKKQIMERAQAEIARIQEGDGEDTESSTENLSG